MKKENQFLFETRLRWVKDSKGILSSRMANDPIIVSTPKVFKGVEAGFWSPEDLLLGSISSCFMTTFLFHAGRKGLIIKGFECNTIGNVDLTHGHLKLTEVNIYPRVFIASEQSRRLAEEVIELTKQNCLIVKALSVISFYHPVIEIKQELKENGSNSKKEIIL